MHVFKISWNLMIHAWKTVLIYIVMVAICVLLAKGKIISKQQVQAVKVPVLLINEEAESELSSYFVEFMSDYVEFVDMDTEETEQMTDSLFYDGFECVIRIPEDFTSHYLLTGELAFTRYHFMETDDTVLVEMLLNQFIMAMEQSYEEGMAIDELTEVAEEALSGRIIQTITVQQENNNTKFGMYANYISFVLMLLIMSLAAIVLSNLRKDKINKRNRIAMIHPNFIYREATLAILSMAGLVTVAFLILGILVMQVHLEEPAILLISANTLLYSVFCVSLGMLLSISVQTFKKIDLIQQIIAVGTALLGGVFISQSVFTNKIFIVSRLLPTYWFVKLNNDLAASTDIGFHDYQQFAIQGGVIVLYAMVCYVITMIIAENKVKMD